MDTVRIVEFDKWCPNCKYFDKSESDDPCYDCLQEPTNIDSRKPLYYKENLDAKKAK